MSADLERLRRDMAEHPLLSRHPFRSAEELSEHLVAVHRSALAGEYGLLGYLYQRQAERIAELKRRIKDLE